MNKNVIQYNIDGALRPLVDMVMEGHEFGSRAGLTRDLTHVGVTLLHPWQREITHPLRKHNLAAQIAETMWVLSGRDDVEWLERYLPRARDFSDDGLVWRGGYGKRLRRWPRRDDISGGNVIDQLAHVIQLLQEDPNSRRAVISIYDPEVDTANGKDIPCNDFLTFGIRGRILEVGVTIRSNDLMWGWSGINAFEWSALQEMVAGVLGIGVGGLHFNIASLHLYEQHWKRAGDIGNAVAPVPIADSVRFKLAEEDRNIDQLDRMFNIWFSIEEKIRQGNPSDTEVNMFPEPMMQSWLRVLQWWWTGDRDYLDPLRGTRLEASALVALQPAKREEPEPPARNNDFIDYVGDLHTEKHAAYGDSWKKRGEMLGIMANIARKIDRLGSNSATGDESAADTAIDLLVYLAKYRWWLAENYAPQPEYFRKLIPYHTGDPGSTNRLIEALEWAATAGSTFDQKAIEQGLTAAFELLEQEVVAKSSARYLMVDRMLPQAFKLAHALWTAEHQ